MFWFRVLAVAQVALLVRRHLTLLEPDERVRLAKLVAQSKGRPKRNLTGKDREELLGLVSKLEPGEFGRNAVGQLRGSRKR
jgi:predicted ArsR family transcriptional regulator